MKQAIVIVQDASQVDLETEHTAYLIAEKLEDDKFRIVKNRFGDRKDVNKAYLLSMISIAMDHIACQ